MKKPANIIYNPQLELALKGYIPEAGNITDIQIVKDLGKLNKKLATIDTKVFRELKSNAHLSSKHYEIQREEKSLIDRIISRNLDF